MSTPLKIYMKYENESLLLSNNIEGPYEHDLITNTEHGTTIEWERAPNSNLEKITEIYPDASNNMLFFSINADNNEKTSWTGVIDSNIPLTSNGQDGYRYWIKYQGIHGYVGKHDPKIRINAGSD